MAGDQIFSGRAGNPAPEPMSRTCAVERSAEAAFGGSGQECPLHILNWREHVAGEEQGLSEMAGDDFFFIADRSEVDARVPAKQ